MRCRADSSASANPMETLNEILRNGGCEAPLDLAALELATIEFPALDPVPFLDILDSYGREASERVDPSMHPSERLQILNDYFFDELGFHGNEADYYNPRNSCLNEVIVNKTGIPISLSVVYMTIAERLCMPVDGVGLPGHFLVSYDGDGYQTYVDVFHRGRLLDGSQCFELARNVTGRDFSASPRILHRVSYRQILVRMLTNLRSIYLRRREFDKASAVLNLLLEASPVDADNYVLRGAVNIELRNFHAAKADLEQYLALMPQARDRERVVKQIARLERFLARAR